MYNATTFFYGPFRPRCARTPPIYRVHGQRSTVTEKFHRITFQPSGRQGEVPAGISLLDAARHLGVELESICGGHQTCGKCKVAIEAGDFPKFDIRSKLEHVSPPGEREQNYADKFALSPEMRLSCACQVQGDLVVRVPAESQTRKQIIRKAAGVERTIRVDATSRLYYVELPVPHLKDHRGDWQRLQDELSNVHGLGELRIDPLLLRTLQPVLAAAHRTLTVTVWNDVEVINVQPGYCEDLYGIAVDVGTTTVAAHLCHLRTGELLGTASLMNPQVSYGEDLMSRVSYAMMNVDGAQLMHGAIINGLNGLIAELTTRVGLLPENVVELVAVANTTMHHLLLGISPVELGGAPFSLVTHDAVDIKARDLGLRLAPGAYVHIPPCEAGHVGADNVAVLVAEEPYRQEQQVLILDIGTNGEIVLGNEARTLSASSPTGPAFEGAQIRHGMRAADGAIERVRVDPATLAVRYKLIGMDGWCESAPPSEPSRPEAPAGADATAAESRAQRRRRKRDELLNPTLRAAGICGSGIIEAIAQLFLAGIIAPNGRFVELAHERLRTGLGEGGGKAEFVLAWPHETASGHAITVHSDDVRAIQLGKAALYAGARLLMRRLEIDRVECIVLAGGFGSYIDPLHAMILGLIPDCDLARVRAVGNAAGDGARMILLDRQKRVEAEHAARWVHYVETAVEPSFQDEFVAAINIPHASDTFPHLAETLAQAQAAWPPERHAALAALQNTRRTRRARRARRAR